MKHILSIAMVAVAISGPVLADDRDPAVAAYMQLLTEANDRLAATAAKISVMQARIKELESRPAQLPAEAKPVEPPPGEGAKP